MAQVADYARIAEEHNTLIHRPVGLVLNRMLKPFGVGPQSMTLFVVKLADTYLQLTVPSFEFPRAMPPSVRFIGRLPIIPNKAPLPSRAGELDGSRKVALVTQGTEDGRQSASRVPSLAPSAFKVPDGWSQQAEFTEEPHRVSAKSGL